MNKSFWRAVQAQLMRGAWYHCPDPAVFMVKMYRVGHTIATDSCHENDPYLCCDLVTYASKLAETWHGVQPDRFQNDVETARRELDVSSGNSPRCWEHVARGLLHQSLNFDGNNLQHLVDVAAVSQYAAETFGNVFQYAPEAPGGTPTPATESKSPGASEGVTGGPGTS